MPSINIFGHYTKSDDNKFKYAQNFKHNFLRNDSLNDSSSILVRKSVPQTNLY